MSIRGITAGSNVTSAAASDVTFLPSGTGAVSRTVQAALRSTTRASDYSTAGYFNTATAALTEDIGVYSVRSIQSTLAPAQYSGITGSLGLGPIYTTTTRTGGYGQYGNWLSAYLVTDSVTSGEFDCGITSWVTNQNFGGGSNFGMWAGANTPSGGLGQTYTSGATIGMEVNAGNRWADFGLQTDIGGTRYTIGEQIVPDVLPALDGIDSKAVTITIASPGVVSLTAHGFSTGQAIVFGGAGTMPTGITAGTVYYVITAGLTADAFQFSATYAGSAVNTTGSFVAPIYVLPSYPGSFGTVWAASVHGHKWWVGTLVRSNSIMKGGHAHYASGGSAATNEPLSYQTVVGNWGKGIDLSSATISSTNALKLAAGHSITIGGATISGGSTGAFAVSTATTNTGTLYSNNYGTVNLQWDYSGAAARLGFFGVTPALRPASYGTPTNVSKTASLAGTSASLSEVGGTLAALIADLKTLGILAA